MVCVVIPCYKTRERILPVIQKIGPEVAAIFVVDDACPDQTGTYVEQFCSDPRVRVIFHEKNTGVGGAFITGMKVAIERGAEIVVKLDGDGQMDPGLISSLIRPIIHQKADFAKGNRFFRLESLQGMPRMRLIGNAALSFFSKLSSGYWSVMDPTNGFLAIHAKVAKELPWEKIARRYFFESDLLFRLSTIRAVVTDIPMKAVYGGEKSNLKVGRALFEFLGRHLTRIFKRIFYLYILRDFNAASLMLLTGLPLSAFGVCFGLYHWYKGVATLVFASSGTVMLAAMPVILGGQLLLSALQYDIGNEPRKPIHPDL
jgi:glycosyltransferase involved in cell wall biosynthesis